MVLPGTTVDFSSVIQDGLPPGNYVAEALIRYEGLRPAAAKLPFTVAPRKKTIVHAGKVVRELNFGVENKLIQITAPPGSVRSTGLAIINKDDRKISVQCYTRAMNYTKDGEFVRLKTAKGYRSCGDWVSINPSDFVLQPGEMKYLNVVVDIPRDISGGGRYADVVFAGTDNSGGSVNHTISHVPLFVTVSGQMITKASIEDIQVIDSGRAEPTKFLITVKNTGTIHISRPFGRILVQKGKQLSGDKGTDFVEDYLYETVEEVVCNVVNEVILPGGARNLTASSSEALSEGVYRLYTVVEYGENLSVVEHKAFIVEDASPKNESERNILKTLIKSTKQLVPFPKKKEGSKQE